LTAKAVDEQQNIYRIDTSMEFLFTAFAFVVLIGILVFVHELGHFLAAKWTGMRADVFAIGMGPRVMGWNPITGFSFGKLSEDVELGDKTDYRLCALPIGGYVKIVGMVDESLDTETMASAPQPWEFRSKKNWQKAIVLVAGVFMNIVLAIALYAAINMTKGRDELLVTTVGYVSTTSGVHAAGIRSGDRILAIDGQTVESWDAIIRQLLSTSPNPHRVTVRRPSGQQTDVSLSADALVQGLASTTRDVGMAPAGARLSAQTVELTNSAGRADIKPGDAILAIDSIAVASPQQMIGIVRSSVGKSIRLHLERGDSTFFKDLTVGSSGRVGIGLAVSYEHLPTRHIDYGVVEAISKGTSDAVGTAGMIAGSVVQMVRGTVSAKESIGGPIAIAKMAGNAMESGVDTFLIFMALISVSLAVMNLLPLPGLDGGHLVFVLVETIIRREISTSIKIRVQQIGMALLLALMAYVLFLDLTR
jgi:regulator of sigma E protease